MDFEINKPKLIKQITVDNPQQTAQAEQLEDERRYWRFLNYYLII